MSIVTPSATLENFVYWTGDEVPRESRKTFRKKRTEDPEEDVVIEAEESELYPINEDEEHLEEEVIDEAICEETESKGKDFKIKRPSVYVRLCEEMITTVLKDESYLFSQNELSFLDALGTLSYDARFLFVRLLLRKPDKWFRIEALRYAAELGTEDRIENAMEELCAYGRQLEKKIINSNLKSPVSSAKFSVMSKIKIKNEAVDITLEDDDPFLPTGLCTNIKTAGPSISVGRPKTDTPTEVLSEKELSVSHDELELDRIANDDSVATLGELLECLNLEELRSIGRTMKLSKLAGNRTFLINSLLGTASNQSTLQSFFAPIRASPQSIINSESLPPSPNTSPKKTFKLRPSYCTPAKRKNTPQTETLKQLVMEKLKKCIKIRTSIHILFRRMHIVYFRSTEFPTSIMTPALMARFRKWNYSAYKHTRTPKIFPSREALLAYEKALELEAQVDALLDGPSVLATDESNNTANIPVAEDSIRRSPRKKAEKEDESSGSKSVPLDQVSTTDNDSHDALTEKKVTKKMPSAKRVLAVFEQVYPRWKDLVAAKNDEQGRGDTLERFDEGWVLTRIVTRAVDALGILYEYEREIEVLEALLDQTRWRRGKRGTWYDRWALVLSNHLPKRKRDATVDWKSKARDVVLRGLDDPFTHSVDKPTLERRLTRLEKNLSEDLRRPCEHLQKKANSKTFEGVKVDKRAKSAGPSIIDNFIARVKPKATSPPERRLSKSVWVGANMEEVTVETLALHHYFLEFGYKGIHSEGRVVRTLYGLLFWDIIFAAVPGAFETPYQSAPLDIVHDSFYRAREEIIEERLTEIEYGRAAELIRKVDSEHRPRKTLCVGVRWDSFEVEVLVEIAQCLGGKALSAICRVICEDYAKRTSGVPDLLVWHPERKEAMFVEVKGPGDKLQENQKVWIDVFLRNDIPVEVCLIEEKGAEMNAKKNRKESKRKRSRSSKAKDNACSDDDCKEDAPDVESEDEQDCGGASKSAIAKTKKPRKRLKLPTDIEIICLD